MDYIQEKVHELYWKDDINCVRTMLICLRELFDIKLDSQVLNSAVGLHGAGQTCRGQRSRLCAVGAEL